MHNAKPGLLAELNAHTHAAQASMLLQVFIAKIPGALKESEVEPVFAQLGTVVSVVLFRASPQDVFNKVHGFPTCHHIRTAASSLDCSSAQLSCSTHPKPQLVLHPNLGHNRSTP